MKAIVKKRTNELEEKENRKKLSEKNSRRPKLCEKITEKKNRWIRRDMILIERHERKKKMRKKSKRQKKVQVHTIISNWLTSSSEKRDFYKMTTVIPLATWIHPWSVI